jgi:uncharacterized protein YecE (DUF72 family)
MWERKASRNERYDYDYSDAEIQRWVPVIAGLATDVKEVYVYFNNHYQGKAAKNAKTLEGFLESFVRGSTIQRLPLT